MSTSEFKAIPVRPCIKCSAAERDKRGDCKACARAMKAAYLAANTEKTKATAKAYRAANADKLKADKAAWHTANNDRAKANMAAWRAANPERKKESDAAWRAANPERARATRDAWYAENSNKAKANSKAWRVANPDRAKANSTAWRAANPERRRAAGAAWKVENPEICKVSGQNQRAKRSAAEGKLSAGLAKNLLKLQQGKCPCCQQPLGNDFHLDHVMPLSRGGLNIDSNMQLLRAVCNLNKSAKDPIRFMQQRGFLL